MTHRILLTRINFSHLPCSTWWVIWEMSILLVRFHVVQRRAALNLYLIPWYLTWTVTVAATRPFFIRQPILRSNQSGPCCYCFLFLQIELPQDSSWHWHIDIVDTRRIIIIPQSPLLLLFLFIIFIQHPASNNARRMVTHEKLYELLINCICIPQPQLSLLLFLLQINQLQLHSMKFKFALRRFRFR